MKKIILKLRTWLIHKLGGFTLGENYKQYILGKYIGHKFDKEYADSLYGLPAEEWCKKMYDRLKYNIETNKP